MVSAHIPHDLLVWYPTWASLLVAGLRHASRRLFRLSLDGVVFSGKDPLHKTHGAQVPLCLHRQLLTLLAWSIVLPWGWWDRQDSNLLPAEWITPFSATACGSFISTALPTELLSHIAGLGPAYCATSLRDFGGELVIAVLSLRPPDRKTDGGAYRTRTGDNCLEGRCVTVAPMLHV